MRCHENLPVAFWVSCRTDSSNDLASASQYSPVVPQTLLHQSSLDFPGLQSSAYPPNVTMYSQPGGQSFAFTPGHGIQPQHMSTPNPNYGDHYMYGQHPMTPYPMVSSSGTGPAPIADVTFSGKHNGICIYFSRIIRPLWDNKIVSDIPYQTPAGKSQFVSLLFAHTFVHAMCGKVG